MAVASSQDEADALQSEVAPPTDGVARVLGLRFFKISALGLSHKVCSLQRCRAVEYNVCKIFNLYYSN